jgi:hypothetical protein
MHTEFRSSLYGCKTAVLQHYVQIPECYEPVFGWLFGPSVGADNTRVKIPEFGDTLSYQNTFLRKIASEVIVQIYKDYETPLCQIVLEKGNKRTQTRETVHIFVNADLPVEIAKAAAALVEAKLIGRASEQITEHDNKKRGGGKGKGKNNRSSK